MHFNFLHTYIYTHTHFFWQLPSSLLLPASPSGVVMKERADYAWRHPPDDSEVPPKVYHRFSHSTASWSSKKFLTWTLISRDYFQNQSWHLLGMKANVRCPCNHSFWTWQDESAEANLNSGGVTDYLETHRYDAICNILAHYSIRNSGLGKQSKALTVFSTYMNSVKWSTVHS